MLYSSVGILPMSKQIEESHVPKRSYKERERERREHEILLAASRLILEGGYAQLTMDDLAEAVGISKPTLYQHFKSKEELIARVIQESMMVMIGCMQEPSDRRAVERLEQVLRLLLEKR